MIEQQCEEIEKHNCDKCDGKGYLERTISYTITCNKCGGEGKLDWIEMVLGKPEDDWKYCSFSSSTFSSSSGSSSTYTSSNVIDFIKTRIIKWKK